MYENEILTGLLISRCGIQALPKADGRVEIPQSLVKSIGWHKHQVVFISKKPGELIICGQHSDDVICKTTISCGRIRIPAGALRSVGFENKPLLLMLGDGCIVVRIDCRGKESDIKQVLGQIEPSNIKELSTLLLGGNRQFEKPKFFLLQRLRQLVARPIKPPFRFPGYLLSTKELVLFKTFNKVPQKPTMFYLLPIIKMLEPTSKERYNFGFLLLTEENYGAVVEALRRASVNAKKPNRSLIFLYRPFSLGMWSVYVNPPDDIPEEIVNKAVGICNNPEIFLRNYFREFEEKDTEFIIHMPPPISKENLEKFKCLLEID